MRPIIHLSFDDDDDNALRGALPTNPRRLAVAPIAIVSALALAPGCYGWDPGPGTTSVAGTGTGGATTSGTSGASVTAGSGGATGGPMGLPGVKVECCFFLYDKITQEKPNGCVYDYDEICVDPSAVGDGDGSLDDTELFNLCSLKCPTSFDPPWSIQLFDPVTGLPLSLNMSDGCVPVLGESSVDASEGTCDPNQPGQLDPYPNDEVWPTNEATLASGGNSQSQVTVNGVQQTVEYTGDIEFYLRSCMTHFDGSQTCDLSLRALDIALVGQPVFGNYRVDDALLTLASWQTTTIDLARGRSGYSGSFVFAGPDKPYNYVDLNLNVEQTNLSTDVAGGGSLLLSNGPNGLGGLTDLTGTLEVDFQKEYGTIELQGSGSDAFGGDFASATFDLTGRVAPWNP